MAVPANAVRVSAGSSRRRRMRIAARLTLAEVARVYNVGKAEAEQLTENQLSRMERGLDRFTPAVAMVYDRLFDKRGRW